MPQVMDAYADPEQAIAALNRQRTLKLWAVVGGLLLILALMLVGSGAMFLDEPDAAKAVPAAAK